MAELVQPKTDAIVNEWRERHLPHDELRGHHVVTQFDQALRDLKARLAEGGKPAKAIEEWLSKSVRNTALARDTAAWNALHAALPALLEALAPSAQTNKEE